MIAAALIPLAPVVLVLVRSGHPSMKIPFSRLLAVSAHDNAHARSQGWEEISSFRVRFRVSSFDRKLVIKYFTLAFDSRPITLCARFTPGPERLVPKNVTSVCPAVVAPSAQKQTTATRNMWVVGWRRYVVPTKTILIVQLQLRGKMADPHAASLDQD